MAKTKTTKNNPTRGQRAEKTKGKKKSDKKGSMKVSVAGGGVKLKRNSTA